MHFCYVVSLSEKTLCVRPSAAASATHLETKHVPYKRHRAKRVKLVILDNKSRLKVRVAMVTVLKPVSAEISQISYRFLLGAPCPPQPLRWVAVAETVDPSLPSAILLRISSHSGAPPLHPGRSCPNISIIGLSCIHLSADAP